jgi:uncharacterized protein YgbK (DUF1537 family)
MNYLEKNIDVQKSYPPVDEKKVDLILKEQLKKLKRKIIVLDDDPTGIQAVHGVSVYTDWSKESIRSGFQEENSMFFILTNSRGLTEPETILIHNEIAENIAMVAKETKEKFILISRGDSTLRGHYPIETMMLKSTVEKYSKLNLEGEVIVPFFKEGGRFTIDNVHYVKYGSKLIPVGSTEFAKDKTFGYEASHLGEWCEEKTLGKYTAENSIYITINDLRNLKYEEIIEMLSSVHNFNKIIVNAIDYIDIKIFTICIISSILSGKEFLFRSAAALPKIIGGISDIPLLRKDDVILNKDAKGGIILVGSHVQKTTEQLKYLMDNTIGIEFIEFDVNHIFHKNGLEEEVNRIAAMVETSIKNGKTVAVYTSRNLLVLNTEDKDKILQASVNISNSLVQIISKLSIAPKFIIAKGGITSSDVGTKALKVKKAKVMGQIEPGVPVWMTGSESKFPGLPYIIFPGNVGEKNTLNTIVNKLISG